MFKPVNDNKTQTKALVFNLTPPDGVATGRHYHLGTLKQRGCLKSPCGRTNQQQLRAGCVLEGM